MGTARRGGYSNCTCFCKRVLQCKTRSMKQTNTHTKEKGVLMEIWRSICCKTSNWCFESTHGSNEHGEHTQRWYKPFIITPTWRFESLGWRHHTSCTQGAGRWEEVCRAQTAWLTEVIDRKTGLLAGSPSVHWLWGKDCMTVTRH